MLARAPLLGLASLLILVGPAHSDTLFVDAVTGDDVTGAGTQVAPVATMTRAVQLLGAVPGPHTIHVAPGRYDGALGEVFPIQLPQDTALLGSGTWHTVVTGGGSGNLIRLARGTVVSDFTVKRGDVGIESLANGFQIAGPERYVRRCVVLQCGIGIRMQDALHADHGLVVANSVVIENGVGLQAQATDNDFQSCSLAVYGCTISGNAVGLEASKVWIGWELYLTLVGSILRGNLDDSIDGWAGTLVEGCVLADGSPFAGQAGNVAVDPQLLQLGAGDAHLPATSPAIDLGGPAVTWPPSVQWVGTVGWDWEDSFELIADLDGGPRVSGGARDAGADERRAPTLYLLGEPDLGATIQARLQGAAGEPAFVYFAADTLATPLFGFVWLAPPWFLLGSAVLDAGGSGAVPAAIPTDPALAGVSLYFQGIRLTAGTFDGTAPEWLRLLP